MCFMACPVWRVFKRSHVASEAAPASSLAPAVSRVLHLAVVLHEHPSPTSRAQFKSKYVDQVTQLVNRKSLTLGGEKQTADGEEKEAVRPLFVAVTRSFPLTFDVFAA